LADETENQEDRNVDIPILRNGTVRAGGRVRILGIDFAVSEWSNIYWSGEVCAICKRPITSLPAVEAAKKLAEESGLKTGNLCCECYDKYIGGEDQNGNHISRLYRVRVCVGTPYFEGDYLRGTFERFRFRRENEEAAERR